MRHGVRVIAAEACGVGCTPMAAARGWAPRSARVTGAEPCASPCTAKAPSATDGPVVRARLRGRARVRV